MASCIFCNIIAGTIPSEIIYENEHVIAFMDVMPVTKGHVLLVPKSHRENVYELTPEEAGHLFSAAPIVANALKATFNPAGMNLLQNNGGFAGQAVFHFHLHFIPRYDRSDGFKMIWDTKVEEFDSERILGIASQIRSNLA